MGDRAVVVFRSAEDYSPGIYLHWDGYRVAELLEAATPRLRQGDAPYSAARFCGACHEHIPGNLSLGLLSPPVVAEGAVRPDFSFYGYGHGDEGVFVVDVATFVVEHYDWDGRMASKFELGGGE